MNDPAPIPAELEADYEAARLVTVSHSSSYGLAMRLLPAARRPHVYALYAFARTADDIVDEPGDGPAAALERFTADWWHAYEARGDGPADGARRSIASPVLRAVANTAAVFDLPREPFERFLRSMAMDLTVTAYETWDDLLVYMDGSAAVIGELMVPILGAVDPDTALGPARDLGLAFQLTNFLRDITDDLELGRVYLPTEDQQRWGVDLRAGVEPRPNREAFAALIRFEAERCRGWYESSDHGLRSLPSSSARCIRVASSLYRTLLERIADDPVQVLERRVRLGAPRKAAVAGAALLGR